MLLKNINSGDSCLFCNGSVTVTNSWNDFVCNNCHTTISLYNDRLFSFMIEYPSDFYFYCNENEIEYRQDEIYARQYKPNSLIFSTEIYSTEEFFNQEYFNLDFIRKIIINIDLF